MMIRTGMCRMVGVGALGLVAVTRVGGGAPVSTTYPVEGPDDTVAVAAAAVSGWFAAADSFEDSIEIRDVDGALVRTIARGEIEALAPWLDLDGSQDGPAALAWSDSGRLLFALVFDGTVAGDAGPSDVILRYDTFEDALTLFHRLEYSANAASWPHGALAHFGGRLYVGTLGGEVLTVLAERNTTGGTVLATTTVAGGTPVTGLAVDRFAGLLYGAAGPTIYRSNLSGSLSFATVGSMSANVTALAHSTHYGGAGDEGLYVLTDSAVVSRVPDDQAQGQAAFVVPGVYVSSAGVWHDVAATSVGTLLVGSDEDGVAISDDADARLSLEAFIQDEFDQVVAFGRGLVSPDGEPDGWVIDADVIPAWSRFHPATPDGACWVVLLLLMDDYINGAVDAQAQVRSILERYAGLAPDGIGPDRSADGFFEHWIDPLTGFVKPGWGQEYATYSTMKMCLAADRAAGYYPADDAIQEAAREIICNTSNWDAFIQTGTDAVYLIAAGGGGPQGGAVNHAFTEGILFVEQASVFGGLLSQDAFDRWIDRSLWPTATFVTGRPITSYGWGAYLACFPTGYSFLTQPGFRNDPAWRTHVENQLLSHGAWTDDFGPRFFTVFSAGTTKSEWGGYNADSLGNHPGDIATFPSLMSMAGDGDVNPAVSAYHAYRNGARETFKSGASILYRRSAVDPSYTPNSAGLPDVALGGLGLAELISPGAVDAVLAIGYDDEICAPPPPPCPGDIEGDGDTDVFDFSLLASQFGRNVTPGTFGDFDFNGIVNVFDFTVLAGDFGCVAE